MAVLTEESGGDVMGVHIDDRGYVMGLAVGQGVLWQVADMDEPAPGVVSEVLDDGVYVVALSRADIKDSLVVDLRDLGYEVLDAGHGGWETILDGTGINDWS